MSNYIGPKQRPIINALKWGGTLYQAYGRWYVESGDMHQWQNRERCMGLYVRGFIMAEQEDTRTRYVLTEKGKRA